MYNYLHLSSKKEVTSALMAASSSFFHAGFVLRLLAPPRDVECILFPMPGLRVFPEGRGNPILLTPIYLNIRIFYLSSFFIQTFESSRNLCTIEDGHETRLQRRPSAGTLAQRAESSHSTPQRKLGTNPATSKLGGQAVGPQGREALSDLDLTGAASPTQVTVPQPFRSSWSSSTWLPLLARPSWRSTTAATAASSSSFLSPATPGARSSPPGSFEDRRCTRSPFV